MERERALRVAKRSLVVVPARVETEDRTIFGFGVVIDGPGHLAKKYFFRERRDEVQEIVNALSGQLATELERWELIEGGNTCLSS